MRGLTAHGMQIRHRFVYVNLRNSLLLQLESHFPEPAMQMDITADSMVMCIVPIPDKCTMLNTVTSKYGWEHFGCKQKNLQRN